jgi:hypothetical protein
VPRRRLLPRSARAGLPALALCSLALAHPAQAQRALAARSVGRGEALLRAGRVADAESAFYLAASQAPRDPAARLALGRYLAARGALRVGAVLMEEARYFGADSAAVARELAPVYLRLADFAALASLPRTPLSAPERERAAWLRDHPSAVLGDDSVTVAFAGGGPIGIGTFRAVVGADTVMVAVDPGVSGWVLDPALARSAGVRLFGTGPVVAGRTVGAADVRLGARGVTRVPVRFERTRAAPPRGAPAPLARVGLDALGAFAPTFDTGAGVLTLRRDGRVRRGAGDRLAVLLASDGAYVPHVEGLVPLARAGDVRPAGRRWTFDRRRGEIVVER